MGEITAKQLIDKLSTIDPNTKFVINQTYAWKDDENGGWMYTPFLNVDLFRSKDINGKQKPEDYDKIILSKIKYDKYVYKIINEADFMGIAFVSEDEYTPEVNDIIKRIPKCKDVSELQNMLYNVFSDWFSTSIIPKFDNEIYKSVAEKLNRLVITE